MAEQKDSIFWRQFAIAIQIDEAAKSSPQGKDSTVLSDTWLKRQRQKRRRTFICGFFLLLFISIFITAVVVVIWWFASHDWLRNQR